jgi:biotin carboxyl carrier protein
MNARVVAFPLLVLLVGGGVAYLCRPRTPPGAPLPGSPPIQDVPAPAHGGGDGGAKKDRPFKAYPVRKGEVPKVERFPARVRTPDAVPVRTALTTTPVERVLVREGDAVKKGDVVARMLGATYERALAAAEKAGDPEAAAKAREALKSLDVVAPADGIVYRVDAREGERPLLRNGVPLPLVTLYDWRQLSYEGTAPVELAELLRAGAEVFVQAGKEFPVAAKVEKALPPDGKGGIPLEVRPTAAPERVPEREGDAQICVATGKREVNVVPAGAVRMVDGRPTVDVVGLTGGVTARNVVVGLPSKGGFLEVSGVEMGESVAVYE